MGYIFIATLIIILAIFFGITIHHDKKRFEKVCKQAIDEAESFRWCVVPEMNDSDEGR